MTPNLRARGALLIVTLLAASALLLRAQSATAVGDAQTSVLANGLTVSTRYLPAATTVSVAVAVRAGGRDETPSLRGGSHYLEHISFLGTPTYPSEEEIFGVISAVGGDLNAGTDNESTTYWATVPAGQLDVPLDLLAEMLTRATFPRGAAERERGVVQEELRGGAPGSLPIALDRLGEALLGPAGQDAGGTVESVGAIPLDELLAYGRRRYTARNMVVAVVGPYEHAQVVAAAGRAFAALPAGERLASTPPSPPVADLRLEGESPYLSIVAAGHRIPGLDSPDAPALLVLDAILDTPGTRMAEALDEANFGNGGTRIIPLSDVGLWVGFAYTSVGRANAVAEVVRGVLRRLQTELVPAAELDAATRYLAGATLLASEGTQAQAVRLASLRVLGVYTSEAEYAARIRAVTAEDVQRVARLYLDPDTLSILAQR